MRRLRGAWRGMAVAEHEVTIVLQDGEAVRIGIDSTDVEFLFEAHRLRAEIEPTPGVFGIPTNPSIRAETTSSCSPARRGVRPTGR